MHRCPVLPFALEQGHRSERGWIVMRQVIALVFALVGIGGAVAMFLVKTDETVDGSGAFGNGVRHVHPAWATAVGIAFLLVGLGLAAFALLGRGESTRAA
jgi:hypothetical protein